MPTPVFPEAPRYAHAGRLATIGSVWRSRDSEQLVVCTGKVSLKARNRRRHPRMAMSIVDCANPTKKSKFADESPRGVWIRISR